MATILVSGEIKNGKIWAEHITEEANEWEGFKTVRGWVPWIFDQYVSKHFLDSIDQDGRPSKFEVPVKFVRKCYIEHSNGSRTNNKQYSSIEEYIADPFVKELYLTRLSQDMFDLSNSGESQHLDLVYVFSLFGRVFHLSTIEYDVAVDKFEEWYSEAKVSVAQELELVDVWELPEDALAGQQKADDLFGERYFPVAKFDLTVTSLEEAKDACEYFKGCSKPLKIGNHVYIGIRSKGSELDGIFGIYGISGRILKDREWDW